MNFGDVLRVRVLRDSAGVLAASGVTTVALGYFGYRQYMPELDWYDWLYFAAQLLTLSFQPDAANAQAPLLLQLARAMGAVFVGTAVIAATWNLLRHHRQRRRAKRMRRHVVIIGSTPVAAELAEVFGSGTNSGRGAVLVGSLDSDVAERLSKKGVIVVDATPSDLRPLVAAVEGADLVIISGLDDAETARTASRLLSLPLRDDATRSFKKLSLLIESQRSATAFLFERGTAETSEVDVCLLPRRTTQVLLELHPPRTAGKPAGPVFVIGAGAGAGSLIEGAVWRSFIPGDPLSITWFASELESAPLDDGLRTGATIELLTPDQWSRNNVAERIARQTATSGGRSTAYIAGVPDWDAVALAADIAAVAPRCDCIAVIEARGDWNAVAPLLPNLWIVPKPALVSDPRIVLDDPTTLLAREFYADHNRWPKSYTTVFGYPSDMPWSELDEATQKPFRQAAREVPQLVSEAALQIVPRPHLISLTPTEIRALANAMRPLFQNHEVAADTSTASAMSPADDADYRLHEFVARLPWILARLSIGLRRIDETVPHLDDHSIDRIAALIHHTYSENDWDTEAARQTWSELSEEYKEANRAQARDIPVKLAFVRRSLAALDEAEDDDAWLDPSTIERLAICEHRRWSHQKVLRGWSYGRPRDDAHLIHPDLVPWSELSERAGDREKDREPVRRIPAYLREVGLTSQPVE